MDAVRPTKKQKRLFEFIEKFISEHGYGPSYREIMRGLDYKSVATVALHVDNLITRGHLTKRTRSARSLEVVDKKAPANLPTSHIKPSEEKWLIEKIDYQFSLAENSGKLDPNELDKLYVLVGALRVLELEGAAQSFIARLKELKDKV